MREFFRSQPYLILQFLISLVFLGAFVYVLWWITHEPAPLDASFGEALLVIVGQLMAITAGISGYWVGTSLSSYRKDTASGKALVQATETNKQGASLHAAPVIDRPDSGEPEQV